MLNRSTCEQSDCGIRTAALPLLEHKLSMRFLLDRTSVEGFFNDGILTMTGTVYPSEESNKIELYSDGLVNVRVVCYQLKV